MEHHTKFVVCALGIFVSYFYFGILQEKVTKGKYQHYNENNELVEEKFTYALALVFAQCLTSYIFSKAYVSIKNDVEEKTNGLTLLYCGAAITYLLAMVCSNMTLQWIPYPTQVVAKSAKPIPVMLLGVLVSKKSYTLKKYVFVCMVVVGIVLFMYKDQVAVSKGSESTSFGFGELLLVLSLIMDGLTGAMQELMRSKAKPSGERMMLNMNFWSCIYLIVALLLSGEGFAFINFVMRYPVVLSNIATMAFAGAIGQHFIYLMVSGFGPLPVSIVTTTRKFATVMFSVIFFANPLSARQWMGATIVFVALFLDAYYSKSGPKKKEVEK